MKKILVMLMAGAISLMAGGNITKAGCGNNADNTQVVKNANTVKNDAEVKRQKAIEAEYKKIEEEGDLFDD